MKSHSDRLFAVILFSAALAATAEEAKIVTLTDTPALVQKTVAARIGDGHVEEIHEHIENSEKVFEVDFSTKAGSDQDFTVAEDGTVLCVGVTFADTPNAVQKGIQSQLHGWEIRGINKYIADTDISFDVTVAKAGVEKTFNLLDDGTLSSVEMELSETPPPVQAAVKAQINGANVQSITEDLSPDGNSFEVEATAKDGSMKSFTLAPDGQMLSEEVTLEQVPPPARRVIQEKIEGGKIVRIDKSLFAKKGNGLPYEVQGRKNGRAFNFSVGPRGRFLGMDE